MAASRWSLISSCASVERQLQSELHDFLDVGAGVALGLLGQLIQVELLRLTLAAAQVDAEDVLAFGVRGKVHTVQLIEPALTRELDRQGRMLLAVAITYTGHERSESHFRKIPKLRWAEPPSISPPTPPKPFSISSSCRTHEPRPSSRRMASRMLRSDSPTHFDMSEPTSSWISGRPR
jgi:hypothetical protein